MERKMRLKGKNISKSNKVFFVHTRSQRCYGWLFACRCCARWIRAFGSKMSPVINTSTSFCKALASYAIRGGGRKIVLSCLLKCIPVINQRLLAKLRLTSNYFLALQRETKVVPGRAWLAASPGAGSAVGRSRFLGSTRELQMGLHMRVYIYIFFFKWKTWRFCACLYRGKKPDFGRR